MGGATWFTYSISAVLLGLVVSLVKRRSQKTRTLPRGPKGWPILGNLLDFFDKPFHLKLIDYAKVHGPVYTITALGRPSVILNDIESIREALITRSPNVDSKTNWRFCFMEMLKGISVLPYGQRWKNTRRRAVKILRDFGMGKIEMEKKIVNEGLLLLSKLVEMMGDGKKNVDVRATIRRAPVHIISEVLFGKRYSYDGESDITKLLTSMGILLDNLATMSVHDLLPETLRPLVKHQLKDFERELANLETFFQGIVNEHKLTYNKSKTRDFVDAWFAAEDAEEEKKVFSPLRNVLQDLMFAGAHSSAFGMTWIVLFLTLHKDIQEEVYEEINSVVKDRLPSMTDRPQLILVEAVILESLRIATLVPVVGHACYDDTVIAGNLIPKGTEVIYNNWPLNYDEKVFPNSKCFRPHRWITKDGCIDKHLMAQFFPFGIGKRQCPGENLGKMELFLLTTILFQNLETLMPDDSVEEEFMPKIEYVCKFMSEPKQYKLRIRKRPECNSTLQC